MASSRQGLIDQGYQEAYEAALGRDGARIMQEAGMVTQWLPLEVAERHYKAADAIGLTVAQMHQVGNVVGARLEGSLMGGMARLARAGGMTPWTPLARLDRLWFRMYEGGSLTVIELGPKDVRVEIGSNPLADIPYWRIALTGLLHGAATLFASTSHTVLEDSGRPRGAAHYRMSWV